MYLFIAETYIDLTNVSSEMLRWRIWSFDVFILFIAETYIDLTNVSSEMLRWTISSFAPPYVKVIFYFLHD